MLHIFRRLFKKRPVTHAVALWIAVGFSIALLIVGVGMLLVETRQLRQVMEAAPPAYPVAASPAVFGTVTRVMADGTLEIDSKQPYDKVYTDELTVIMSIGGTEISFGDIEVGALISATGPNAADGGLTANAIVILDA